MIKKCSGLSTEKSLKTNSLFGDFTEDKVGKTLLLRFHREVGAFDVADALGEALKPQLGDEKGEKLLASTTGKASGASTINIKGLCTAIFMVYLGDCPVSRQAEGFVKGFEALTKQ
ncbi:hypothetical protein ACHAWO_012993 [Cyclotella atomus]|uniref:Uncharacterized protein n=1 Tax=Cyclotella atomus TaxID=382360 RepID=A0ABD3NHD8_9STRA